MKKENLLYLVLISTIVLIRTSVGIFPEVNIKIFSVIIHHFWSGMILFGLGLIIPKKKAIKIWFLGIGLGLMIDQLTFIVLGAGSDKEYWALPSLLGAIILGSLIYPVRKKLKDLLLK